MMDTTMPLLFDLPSCVTQAAPRSFHNDPSTAKKAANSPAAKNAVVRGTARCLLLLAAHPEGLTDNEAIEGYLKRYPQEVAARGIVGCVRSVMRNWCMLKPNEDERNKRKENLDLIQPAPRTRVNPYTGLQNVVFEFKQMPTLHQIGEWQHVSLAEE